MTTCFSIYKVESLLRASEQNTTNHGIQIPRAVKYSPTSIQLSLTVDSELVDNEQYSAIITDVNANGESLYNVTMEFGIPYCIQT